MKKLIYFTPMLVLILLASCGTETGELVGVQSREAWYEPKPTGMVFIRQGSYNMGLNDQDVPNSMTAFQKTVSIAPFWIDETEIINNEYRQFVYWVRDSIAYKMLGDDFEQYLITQDDNGEDIDPPYINWFEKIEWDNPDQKEVLEELYLPEHERYCRRRTIDARKLNFEYWWTDIKQAAKKFRFGGEVRRSYDENKMVYEGTKNEFQKGALDAKGMYSGEIYNYSRFDDNRKRRTDLGELVKVEDRHTYIMHDIVNVYPDTLVWIDDFTYNYNEPMAKMYFWHPAYDAYPVVGISWRQANAFSNWRTGLLDGFLRSNGATYVQNYRLPTESEWEYAARGGLKGSMYPWGGYYAINVHGCYIANFKPLRGNYPADGNIYTSIVAHNEPNEWGVYDMGGNVAEWTSNAFDESAYQYTDDLMPDYMYEAKPNDPIVKKRKVIRGGSWKDVAYFMQCGVRTYEYQDSAKSYIGFRNVRSYLGHDYNDAGSGSLLY